MVDYDLEKLVKQTEGIIYMFFNDFLDCLLDNKFNAFFFWRIVFYISWNYVGYSGSDLQALCEEAAMMPIRELGTNILTVKENQVWSGFEFFYFFY